MQKDILMLVYDELNWEENHSRAEKILGRVKVVKGESSMIDSFQKCCHESTTDLFVMIDGDNYIFESSKEHLDFVKVPTQFFAVNEFGIKYGHGGIKVIDRKSSMSGFAVDVTERLFLNVVDVALSRHDFGYSPYAQWRTIFKELIKLTMWGNDVLLNSWLSHSLPRAIMDHDVIPYLKNATIESTSSLLLNNVGLIDEFNKVKCADHLFDIMHMNGNPCEVEGY